MTEHNISNHPDTPDTGDRAADDKWDHSEFQPQAQASWMQQHKRELTLFTSLSVLLLGVVFWLPNLIAPVTPEQTPASTHTETAADSAPLQSAPKTQGPLESPWQDAQIAKARRQAQEILAQLLDKQNSLEKMQVELWAKDAFAQAMIAANNGDELYRARDFDQAQQSYEAALTQFETLLQQAEDTFTQTMQQGAAAIKAQQASAALSAYELAIAMRPHNSDAQAGLARAQVQEQVIEQLEQADNHVLQFQFEAAKQNAEQALALDEQSQVAKEKLKEIKEALAQANYANAMGQGYNQLQQHQYAVAIRHFKQALTIRPGNQAANDAIVQAGNQRTQAHIKSAISDAESFEAKEQWTQALASYQRAHKLDASLVSARIGSLRTQARATLDQQLQKLIDQPLRLADLGVYRASQQLLADAKAVKPQGPRVQKQAQQLQQALDVALDPIVVSLHSDNATNVTLYRVGSLGNFIEQTLELKPGRYTAVGSRNGYRDVRQEFTVQPGANAVKVVIQCEEKIALGS